MMMPQGSLPNSMSAVKDKVNFRLETPSDQPEISRLMGLGFDAGHARRNIWSLREGNPVGSLCLVAEDPDNKGQLLGSIRYWQITIAGLPSLLLGPLAVDPECRGQGIGKTLVLDSLDLAKDSAFEFCFVSGERDYYPKLGFSKLSASQVDLPQFIEEERLHMISVSDKKIDDLPLSPWVIRPFQAGS